jgi:long-chain acyl-CoA synthetase
VEEEKEMAMNRREILATPRASGINTIPQLFWSRVQEWNTRTAMREKDFGIWRDITWREYGEKVKHVSLALVSLGLKRGDRVAIISENNPEWFYSDMGTLAAGGVSVGIYSTDSFHQVEYVMNHSGATFYIAEDEEQLDKILQVRGNLPKLLKMIVMDIEGLRHFSDPMVMSFEKLLELGKDLDHKEPELFEKLIKLHQPEDVAILIYTSGTTGPPKGAMISNRNLLAAVDAQYQFNPTYMTDELLTFLPLCHIVERGFSVMAPLVSGYVCNFAEEMDTVPLNIREVSPTIFYGVPRIWEKFYSAIILRLKDSTRFEKLAFKWAMAIGEKISSHKVKHQKPPFYLSVLFQVADWAVIGNLKKFVGLDRARMAFSGAAPISPDILKFFHCLGIDMREGYGQTESTGPVTSHYRGDIKFGTVGKPFPGVQIKTAEDGEILIKGPLVFMGYFNDPEKTKETVVDGWLYTGDVGRIDEDGHLIISDRKKDIIITSGGKNITPSEIENQLKFSPYINDAVVIGDARKYLTALIMIDEENVMKYAQDSRIPFTTYASLTRQPEIIKLIEKEMEEVNKKFARVETVKKIRLLDIKLTEEDDEITPTMKLKRKLINQKFRDLIESMY